MNKEITIIDLLNKIANGEEVPTIWVNGRKLRYNKEYTWFDDVDDVCYSKIGFDLDELNDEVEIIEEDKKIKRIQSNGADLFSEYIGEWLHDKDNYTAYDELLMNKINEIIDYINKENK